MRKDASTYLIDSPVVAHVELPTQGDQSDHTVDTTQLTSTGPGESLGVLEGVGDTTSEADTLPETRTEELED